MQFSILKKKITPIWKHKQINKKKYINDNPILTSIDSANAKFSILLLLRSFTRLYMQSNSFFIHTYCIYADLFYSLTRWWWYLNSNHEFIQRIFSSVLPLFFECFVYFAAFYSLFFPCKLWIYFLCLKTFNIFFWLSN